MSSDGLEQATYPRPTPILMYHKIAPVNPRSKLKAHYLSPRLFRSQMTSLAASGYRPIPLSTLLSRKVEEKTVVLTFDDGYENFFIHALPILVRLGFPATVFLVANRLGEINSWDVAEGDVPERLMSASQVREALLAGMEFGSHTLDHADLAAVPATEAWHQICESRTRLEDLLDAPVTTFAYPYGRKTPAVRAMVERAGYLLACGTGKGPNTPETDRFDLHRVNVRRGAFGPLLHYKIRRDLRPRGEIGRG